MTQPQSIARVVDIEDNIMVEYSGLSLMAMVKLFGPENTSRVELISKNGKVVDLEREQWANSPLLLATHRDGLALALDLHGPIRLIYREQANQIRDLDRFSEFWLGQISEIRFVIQTE